MQRVAIKSSVGKVFIPSQVKLQSVDSRNLDRLGYVDQSAVDARGVRESADEHGRFSHSRLATDLTLVRVIVTAWRQARPSSTMHIPITPLI